MLNIELIENYKDLELYNICFISKYFEDYIPNKDGDGLLLWFTDNPMTINYKNDIVVDKEYYLLYIEDFLTKEISGIEALNYQRDGWIDNSIIYRGASYMTPNMINKGLGCWLYNENSDDIICSVDTIYEVIKKFENYKIKMYKLYES